MTKETIRAVIMFSAQEVYNTRSYTVYLSDAQNNIAHLDKGASRAYGNGDTIYTALDDIIQLCNGKELTFGEGVKQFPYA